MKVPSLSCFSRSGERGPWRQWRHASPGNATISHWACASALFSWAKIVFSIAATAVRCLAGACARALRIQ